MAKIPHLVQYQGSKRNLAPIIAGYFPESFDRLIEPFSGTGAVSIYTAANNLCDTFILNDINEMIVDMLRECINNPNRLFKEYEAIWNGQFVEGENNVDYYYKMRDKFNEKKSIPALTLFILARVSKGAIRYNSKGEMNQIGDKRRNGTKPETIKKNAVDISRLLIGKTELFNKDYKEILLMAKPGDLVYMDPPYQGVAKGLSSRYIQSLDFDEFVESLHELNERNIDFIVSYDGQTDEKKFGKKLPKSLELQHVLVNAGRSSQATLNGQSAITYESIYISRGIRKDI